MKSLHKKITDTNTLQGYKHEKNHPSRRARLAEDAKQVVEGELDRLHTQECSDECSYCTDHVWEDGSDYYEQLLELVQDMTPEERKRYLMGDWKAVIELKEYE